MKRIALYAGSFDPPTNGHLWMIRQGAALFDELIVTLAVNPEKQGFLPLDERERLLRCMAQGLPGVRIARLDPNAFLVDFARQQGATHLLRGARNTTDFEYEKAMARMNTRMEPGVQTLLLIPPAELEDLSSTFVRGFVGLNDWQRWVSASVPPCVYETIAARSKQR